MLNRDMAVIEHPSPNFSFRPAPPDVLVLHYTGMQSGPEAVARLCNPDAQVSSHYVVTEGGDVLRLVAEERRAWHAGVSHWRGRTGLNDTSIGIEIVNPGHEFGYVNFPEAQIDAVIGLIEAIRSRWDIADRDIVGHSDIAPSRKIDPGERFPWARLARAGHGLWSDLTPTEAQAAAMGPPLSDGDTGPGVFSLQAALGKLGYDILAGGPYDAATRDIVIAFQRHWLPERIGTPLQGAACAATRLRLMAILRLAEMDDV